VQFSTGKQTNNSNHSGDLRGFRTPWALDPDDQDIHLMRPVMGWNCGDGQEAGVSVTSGLDL